MPYNIFLQLLYFIHSSLYVWILYLFAPLLFSLLTYNHLLLLLLLSCFSCVRLCATHRRQPTRLPHPWDSPGKNTGVGCHLFLLYICEPDSILLYLFLGLFFRFHVSDIVQNLSLCIWPNSLSIVPSGSIHIVANGKTFFNAWVIFHIYLYATHPLFIHQLMDTWKAPIIWLFQIMLLWTFECMYLFELVFLLSSDIYREVEMLDHSKC